MTLVSIHAHHPCLPTVCAIAAEVGVHRLIAASMRWRRGQRAAGPFAVGLGGRVIVRGFGIAGRGATEAEAARQWLVGAREVSGCAS